MKTKLRVLVPDSGGDGFAPPHWEEFDAQQYQITPAGALTLNHVRHSRVAGPDGNQGVEITFVAAFAPGTWIRVVPEPLILD